MKGRDIEKQHPEIFNRVKHIAWEIASEPGWGNVANLIERFYMAVEVLNIIHTKNNK
jgi:hypothetical protein